MSAETAQSAEADLDGDNVEVNDDTTTEELRGSELQAAID